MGFKPEFGFRCKVSSLNQGFKIRVEGFSPKLAFKKVVVLKSRFEMMSPCVAKRASPTPQGDWTLLTQIEEFFVGL